MIRKVAVREGMKSLRQDGWRMVREGRTTVEEVLRVTKEEHVNVASEAPPPEPEGPPSGAANGAAARGATAAARGALV
jgi:hypothetical protein